MTKKMFRNLPNFLTSIRIIATPFIIFTFYIEDVVLAQQLGALLFLIASITDMLDGYFARKFNLQSNFGIIFDPIADKILVGSVILMLVKFNRASEIPCLLILAREFIIAGLREFLANVKVSVPVSSLAKIKTGVQMFALFVLLLGSESFKQEWIIDFGNYCLWFSAILTIITGYSYLKASLKFINSN